MDKLQGHVDCGYSGNRGSGSEHLMLSTTLLQTDEAKDTFFETIRSRTQDRRWMAVKGAQPALRPGCVLL